MNPLKSFVQALSIAASAALLATAPAWAGDPPAPAQAPAPLGVFGADMPGAGKFVLAFTPSFTRMQGSRIGTHGVSAPFIVTHVVSAYTPVGTHLLRLVPRDLTVDSEGFSVAYGVSNDVTLIGQTSLLQKSVDMEAFKGLSGVTPLGNSVGKTDGLGDTTLAVVVRAFHDPVNRLNLNLGLSLPTGSTTDDIALLLPNGTQPAKRGFYAMQPGSGTYDLLAGATYSGVRGPWSWGLSYRARLPLDRNGQGWRYGDLSEANAWAGYSWAPGLETTLRLNGTSQGRITGEDPVIRGYAQGADPLFYGGDQVSLYAGVIASGRFIGLKAMQFGVEGGAPLWQRLNGPQLGRDWQLTLALKYKL
ncbi:MAG TPA: hypothetical protein VJP88_02965 [Caulobacteraceae bacterium]|nr:hypothetical protein [Caulobacteraceae bacterium]